MLVPTYPYFHCWKLTTRDGAHLAYSAKYVATLRYVLPQCWFSQAKLLLMEKKSMGRIISKCGYSSKTPHALLYASRDYAGAGFLHWSTIQGEGQILHFIKHWRTNSNLSKLLRYVLHGRNSKQGRDTLFLMMSLLPFPMLKVADKIPPVVPCNS